MPLTPTDEQRFALEQFLSGDHLVIEAGAGAGKSTTLRLLAEKGDIERGLYVAFNKAVQTHATKLFAGTGIEARTAHSLAYREYGAPLKDRMGLPYLKTQDKVRLFGADPYVFSLRVGATVPRLDSAAVARAAQETVTAFCRSADAELGTHHVRLHPAVSADEEGMEDVRAHVLRVARKIWKDAIDPHGENRVEHDTYLKLWQLSQPELPYDVIFLDEAQDADALMLDVIQSQDAQQVAVGDRSQAIYSWRGAIDAMDAFSDARRAALTQSFRFGPEIADEANLWLELLGTDMRITGAGNPDSTVGRVRRPDAVLVRTNGGAVAEVVESQRRGVKIGLAGQNRAKELKSLAQAAVDLSSRGWTSHQELSLFKSWDEVVDFSQTDEGASYSAFVKVVDTHGAYAIVRAIDACVDPARADLVIATAHVAKGLEWGSVRIGEDFKKPRTDSETGDQNLPSDEELRLAYVAVTRAKDELDTGSLSWAREVLNGELVGA